MPRSALPSAVSIAAIAISANSPAAYAEAIATTEDPALVVAADAASGEGMQDAEGLTAIVVTATKRETDLQETPISIAVMSTDDIKKRHVESLLDLADGAVPSLRVATFEARQSALTIGMRGIVPLDANQPAREQGVGVYIDGVYLGRQHGLNAGLLDVERIEVLKGPQGTLFGRNTEGGAVSIVSKAPTGQFGGRATVGSGNYGSYGGSLHLDLPEYAGVAIKVDAALDHQDATVENPLPGSTGWNYHHRYGGRIAARWRPFAGFTADLAYDLGRDRNTPFYSQLINYNPLGLPVATLAQIAANGNRLPAGTIAPLPPAVVVGGDVRMRIADIAVPQQPSVDKTQGFTANLRYDLGPAELRSITAWRTVHADQWDNSGGAHRTPVFAPNGRFSRYSLATLDQRQFSQELQLVGSLDRLDYVLGLYYFNERANDDAATPNSNQWNATGTAYTILDPLTFPGSARGARSIDRASIAFAKSYAAYGQATWNFSDALHLTAGGRFTHDRKHGRLLTVNNAATNLTFRQTNDRFDPMVTLAWAPADDVNLYAKYATGYRAGGASSRSLIYRSFGPEKVKSYELGAKTEFLDRRVRLNLAGYLMDRTGSQVDFNFFDPVTNRNTLETVNAPGTTRIRGIEADLTLRPTDTLTLGGSYAYTYTRVPPTPNPLLAGNPIQPVFIVFTPKHAFSLAADWETPVGGDGAALKLHADGNYSGRAFAFDNEDVKNEAAFLVNARISVADLAVGAGDQRLTLSLWARNLFDEAHIYRRSNANRRVLGDYANFNAPRTFGAEATVAF
jgi:iron complex outermembrane receptor protein